MPKVMNILIHRNPCMVVCIESQRGIYLSYQPLAAGFLSINSRFNPKDKFIYSIELCSRFRDPALRLLSGEISARAFGFLDALA